MTRGEFFAAARRDGKGPLAGVRVVEATTTWAGPMCGCLFADLGADVIKLEQPDGEVARRLPPLLPGRRRPLGFMHVTANRGKRSLTLDLRQSAGREIALELLRTADVFVENFRPGTLAGWGLGYTDVCAVKPDLVYVSISGWGQWGPASDQAGYDPIAQAASGWLSLNGEPDGAPVKSPTFLGDDLAGLHAAFAALAALRHRDRTGEGQQLDVSLLDVLLFQSNGYPMLAALGVELPRLGSQFQVAAPAGVFRCRDGWIMAGVLLDSHWKILARALGRPELADHPDFASARARLERRAQVQALLADWCAPRAAAEVVECLVRERLPCAPVRSFAEAARDPHVLARDMLQEVELEDGTRAPLVGPPVKYSRTPVRLERGAPALGAHSDEILAELGLDPASIARLRADRIV
ncbi:MAG TPA: CoA transferase [Myxococcota bacterium]|nr:CoA transferase [Myxococcota bacterium]